MKGYSQMSPAERKTYIGQQRAMLQREIRQELEGLYQAQGVPAADIPTKIEAFLQNPPDDGFHPSYEVADERGMTEAEMASAPRRKSISPPVLALLRELATGVVVLREIGHPVKYFVDQAPHQPVKRATVDAAYKAGLVRLVPHEGRRYVDARVELTPDGEAASVADVP